MAAGGISFYTPDIVSATDYYPFGYAMEGRGFSSDNYRYGFNGKEKDTEGMGGGGSTYDYGFRIYNPQIAKFLSVDPLTRKYPMLTTYQFASNTPIMAIDLDGLEAELVIDKTFNLKGELIKVEKTINITIGVVNNSSTTMSEYDLVSFVQNGLNNFKNELILEGYKVNITVVPLVPGREEIDSKFYINIVDNVLNPDGTSNPNAAGHTEEIGNSQDNVMQLKQGLTSTESQRTLSHEFGHALGLRHPKNELSQTGSDPLSNLDINFDPNNLMRQSSVKISTGAIIQNSGVDLNSSQVNTISNQIISDGAGKANYKILIIKSSFNRFFDLFKNLGTKNIDKKSTVEQETKTSTTSP